jgi:hypothetical protein
MTQVKSVRLASAGTELKTKTKTKTKTKQIYFGKAYQLECNR